MINIELSPANCLTEEPQQAVLQQYVRALLARQHALDVLETVQQQINQVWGAIRRLVEGEGVVRATKTERLAGVAEAIRAKNSYRSLERRRELGIAALHQAERRANSALQSLLAAKAERKQRKNSTAQSGLRLRLANRFSSRNNLKST